MYETYFLVSREHEHTDNFIISMDENRCKKITKISIKEMSYINKIADKEFPLNYL